MGRCEHHVDLDFRRKGRATAGLPGQCQRTKRTKKPGFPMETFVRSSNHEFLRSSAFVAMGTTWSPRDPTIRSGFRFQIADSSAAPDDRAGVWLILDLDHVHDATAEGGRLLHDDFPVYFRISVHNGTVNHVVFTRGAYFLPELGPAANGGSISRLWPRIACAAAATLFPTCVRRHSAVADTVVLQIR